jgi:hypothetical protein
MRTGLPFVLCLALAAIPAVAQEQASPSDQTSEGFDLMQQGAELFLRGLQGQIEPTLKDLSDQADELARDLEPTLRLLSDQMGQALTALLARIDDLSYYEMPEILENGDIVIRRKADAPPWVPTPEDGTPSGEVDL